MARATGLAARILGCLQTPQTSAEVGRAVAASPGAIRMALRRLRQQGLVVIVGEALSENTVRPVNVYGLAAEPQRGPLILSPGSVRARLLSVACLEPCSGRMLCERSDLRHVNQPMVSYKASVRALLELTEAGYLARERLGLIYVYTLTREGEAALDRLWQQRDGADVGRGAA